MKIKGTEGGLVERLRTDLLMGEFRAGQWLRLNELEQRYNASRFEVRKALTSLAATNALEYVANYGYRVRPPEPERDKYHREVRLLLELGAAPLVVEHAEEKDIERLRQLASRFEWSIENATFSESIVANNEFHRAFFSLCRNPILEEMINDMRELAWPHALHPYITVARSRISAAEHYAMIQCVENRDEQGLLEVITRHLRRGNNSEQQQTPPGDESKLQRKAGG